MTTPSPAGPRSLPTTVGSAMRVFELSFAQLLWSRRSLFLALLAGAPVVLAALIRLVSSSIGQFQIHGARISGVTVFGAMIWLLYVRFIVPVLGVFYGTALLADEIEDKTITYLFTRPIPRRAVLLGKYLAYVACTVLLVLPSVILVFFLIVPMGGSTIASEFPNLVMDLAMLALGLIAYGAVFAFVGTRLKRPLITGLVFAFGWEPAALLFPGYVRRLTVAYYLQAPVKHEMPSDSAASVLLQLFRDVPSVSASLLGLGVIVAVSLWGAGRAVENREYVLEQ